ncbi:protein lin-28 homolog B-like [Hylaeus volcanicus]|uniref:protein lin-28 homolog B-like n=1 Tax=Hylaeus volcanicus TaxID=313075 RepID=UPI0023B7E6D0|nr:protein lin-28 homolog B-like [Hylaeus volcanicus]
MEHTRQRCTAAADRSDHCYNCGGSDHKAVACSAPPKCSVCTDNGSPAGHRLGSRACPATQKKARGRKSAGPKAAGPAVARVTTAIAQLVKKSLPQGRGVAPVVADATAAMENTP